MDEVINSRKSMIRGNALQQRRLKLSWTIGGRKLLATLKKSGIAVDLEWFFCIRLDIEFGDSGLISVKWLVVSSRERK
jgi:hypothetical protein